MPSMRELIIESPSFKREAKKVQKDLNAIADARMGDVGEDILYAFPQRGRFETDTPPGFKTYEEIIAVGNRALELFHQAIWAHSSPRGDGKNYFEGIPRDVVMEIFDLYSKGSAAGLARYLMAGGILVGRFVRYNSGKARNLFLLQVNDPAKSYPNAEAFAQQHLTAQKQLPHRARVEVEQQAQKAEGLAGPVKTIISIKDIPTPEPNPQSVMEYVQRLTTAFQKMESILETQERRYEAAVKQIEELTETLEKREAEREEDEWGMVVTAIETTKEATS